MRENSFCRELFIDLNFSFIIKKYSLNLSGPGCELKIGKCIPVEDDDGEEIFNITLSKDQDELCETLCENGLGV